MNQFHATIQINVGDLAQLTSGAVKSDWQVLKEWISDRDRDFERGKRGGNEKTMALDNANAHRRNLIADGQISVEVVYRCHVTNVNFSIWKTDLWEVFINQIIGVNFAYLFIAKCFIYCFYILFYILYCFY